jgi:hypothetical protein
MDAKPAPPQSALRAARLAATYALKPKTAF